MNNSVVSDLRFRAAALTAKAAGAASRLSGRGSGRMIGGKIALKLDAGLLEKLGQNRKVAIVTGTNGKSTTTRMLTAAVRSQVSAASNEGGDNMDAGLVAALLADKSPYAVLEVDELHVPGAAEKLDADLLVLLNLSRDQLDRVGEINMIERKLRACVDSRPDMLVIANCDDVMVTSVAFDHPHTIWVSAGNSWVGDSGSCPRTGSHIIHADGDWYATEKMADGREFRRPTPHYTVDETGITIHGETDATPEILPMKLALPGRANRGNAALAFAAARGFLGKSPSESAAIRTQSAENSALISAIEGVDSVAGRYASIDFEGRKVRMLLAKNPAGWQEALTMVDRSADSLVVSVNGQIPDGQDLSWLWDVKFEDFGDLEVKAAGERGADLSVRLTYAGIKHQLIMDTVEAIRACPPGQVEVLANYTAFRDLKKFLDNNAGPNTKAGK